MPADSETQLQIRLTEFKRQVDLVLSGVSEDSDPATIQRASREIANLARALIDEPVDQPADSGAHSGHDSP